MLQTYHLSLCSLSSRICFRSVWCRRTMIPGTIFASFSKFQGILNVHDFRLRIRLQELLQALLCFSRIRLDPLGGHVPHHECISMIVSRSTTFTENFVLCCNLVTKNFCSRYGSENASSAWSLVMLVLWQISQFRSFGNGFPHGVFPNPHFP